jgi:hypothetical protein
MRGGLENSLQIFMHVVNRFIALSQKQYKTQGSAPWGEGHKGAVDV